MTNPAVVVTIHCENKKFIAKLIDWLEQQPREDQPVTVRIGTEEKYDLKERLPSATALYNRLGKGDILREGDEIDSCVDGWRDKARWESIHLDSIGEPVPDPKYPAHRQYRRPV